MSFGVTGIGDFSNNKYAAAMKELANGLAGWSGLLLLPFLIYQIVANDNASFFSVRSFLMIIIGEIVFVIAAHFGNIILANITLPLVMPFWIFPKKVDTVKRKVSPSVFQIQKGINTAA